MLDMLHDEFEWDQRKAVANLKKHGVSFDDAAYVLADDLAEVYHHEQYDEAHAGKEDRFITVASHPLDRSIVLAIAWTERRQATAQITRIITARHATGRERRMYASYLIETSGT